MLKTVKRLVPLSIKKAILKLTKGVRIANSATIEISGFCNADCPYCITGRTEKKERSHNFMSTELFREIMLRLKKDKLLMDDNPGLYNWGEPMLNPEIVDILRTCTELKIRPGISTNASIYVDIPKEVVHNLGRVIFSLSGFKQELYGKIHGFDLRVVLDNIKKYSQATPNSSKLMSFHVYKETSVEEYLLAHDFCKQHSISFFPSYAYFNDFERGMSYLRGDLEPEILRKAENELVLHYVKDLISAQSRNFCCPQFDMITIDETGKLLTCCGLPRGHESYALGYFLDMPVKDIVHSKRTQMVCKECVERGLAFWLHSSPKAQCESSGN